MLTISSRPEACFAFHIRICPSAACWLNGCNHLSPDITRGRRRRSFGSTISSPCRVRETYTKASDIFILEIAGNALGPKPNMQLLEARPISLDHWHEAAPA